MRAGKIDFKRDLDCYQATRDTPRVVRVPDLRYLMIDGRGDPNTAAYADAIATLYPLAYTLEFASRAALGRDYVVMPLEALWWADDMEAFTTARDKARWQWTLMIMVPDRITEGLFTEAVAQVGRKSNPARLAEVRLETHSEGLCVQALHVGSYDDEGELLHRMHHDVVPAHGFTMVGKHHEIYLSDARRVEPAKLRTILRQPVAST